MKFPFKYKSGKRGIFHHCIDCGRIRYVRIRNGKPISERCKSCSNAINSRARRIPCRKGADNNKWKGGICKTSHGYIAIVIPETDPFYSMVNKNGYVYQHRYIMAQHIERALFRYEIVHHKNSIKTDNRIENLALITDGSHNILLNREIKLLQWRVKELENALSIARQNSTTFEKREMANQTEM